LYEGTAEDRMNHVIAVVDNGTELVEKTSICFAFIATEIEGKMFLEVFGGSSGCDFCKK
jgi:hypothetical protein